MLQGSGSFFASIAMVTLEEQGLLQLFAELVPEGQWRELVGGKKRPQIYTLPVVVGMMMLQRLGERGTQEEAVDRLLLGQLDHLLPESKRVEGDKISPNTGAYAKACGQVSVEVVKSITDQLLEELGKRIKPEPELKVPLLLLDGSSLQLEHVPELLEDFPAGRNQYGEGHWGIVKWVALHDVETGIPLRPAWGPMYGEKAVSEQELAREALQRAPAGSVVLGDGNFGIFVFAYETTGQNHRVLFRLSKPRALSLAGGKRLARGERKVVWRPSRLEREKYPALPPEAQIEGRLMVVNKKGFREPLYLFTTLLEPRETVMSWYPKRWNIELDLRTLKHTMRLRHLRGKSTAAVEKELLIAVVAYGLVRAFMALAARRAGLSPRQLSFTRAYGLVNALIGRLCTADAVEQQKDYERMLDYVGKAKLPRRLKPRSYPRAVWGRGKTYPKRGSLNSDAESK